MSEFHGVNLNLLRSLRTLLDVRSVSLAARDMAMTQSAMSHNLKKLRAMFDDQLLLTGPHGVTLTPRAEGLRPRLGRVLDELEEIVREPGAFEPARSSRSFTIGAADYFDAVLLPGLYAQLAQAAPQLRVRTRRVPELHVGQGLTEGSFDLSIGVLEPPQSGIMGSKLFEEGFISCVRKGHPLTSQPVDLDLFLAFPHVLISTESSGPGAVDSALVKLNRKAFTRVTIPTFLGAPYLVMKTDLVLTAPRRALEQLAACFGLHCFAPPVELPSFTLKMFWHERYNADPAHSWFRERLQEVAKKA